MTATNHNPLSAVLLSLLIAALMTFSACGGSSSPKSTPAAPPPAQAAPTVAKANADQNAFLSEAYSYDAAQVGTTFRDVNNDVLTYTVAFAGETHGLSAAGAVISGTPDSIGTLKVTITADDKKGGTASDSFDISIGNRPVLAKPNSRQTARVAVPFSYDASQDGESFTDADGDSLSYTTTLQPGLGLSASGALISGTPSLTGTVMATITADDGKDGTASDSFEIVVQPRPVEQILITQAAGVVNVFVKGSVGPSDKYLRYRFERFDTPSRRAKGWGWRHLHEAAIDQGGNFTLGNKLLNGGENFLAIREVGKSDFMGGSLHGDSIDNSFIMKVDGVERALDGTTVYRATTVEFVQNTTLYEVDVAQSVQTAQVDITFKIEHGLSTLNNRVAFLRPIELSSTFMAMLSAERRLSDAGSLLLTGTGAYSPNFTPFNISNAGHGASRSGGPEEIRLSGPSGYNYSLKMVAGWDNPRRRSYISDDAGYNKLYFSPIGLYHSNGPGLQLPAGEVIEITAEYRLDTTN